MSLRQSYYFRAGRGPDKAALRMAPKRFQNGCMNITLKNVPEKVHMAMKRAAKEQGRSLNAQIIYVLTAEVERRKQAAKWRKNVGLFAASLPRMEDSTPLIRQERERH
jgi:hypothetical protein